MRTDLTPLARHILEKRALKKNSAGKVVETVEEMFDRISQKVASAEKLYGKRNGEIEKIARDFLEIQLSLQFLCGGSLIWAGLDSGMQRATWAKCFVLPVEDSINGIFKTLTDNIQILRRGGGTGFNFSHLRSSYATVTTTGEKAAGPIKYLKLFNDAQNTITGRGGRKMGSLAVLNVDHPDIVKFIKLKESWKNLEHYNISVGVSEKFMQAVLENDDWELIDPYEGNVTDVVKARKLFRMIAQQAHNSGDPGLFFLDRVEKDNVIKYLGVIESANPCGEQPLLPYESCNLGNINLTAFVNERKSYIFNPRVYKWSFRNKMNLINWKKLEKTIFSAIRYLDNIIDINYYPIPEVEQMTKRTRNIGLGVMGVADLLASLGVPYASREAIKVCEELMKFIQKKAWEASQSLGEEKGSFPEFSRSSLSERYDYARNSRTTTVAPTGTVSLIANCNSGIEPAFALAYQLQNSLHGEKLDVMFTPLKRTLNARQLSGAEIFRIIAETGGVQETDLPQDIKNVFKTAHEVSYKQHIKIQAAFQKYVDSGVSKTINMPYNAKVKDVEEAYMLAYKLKCKGITVFRDRSRSQAISVKK